MVRSRVETALVLSGVFVLGAPSSPRLETAGGVELPALELTAQAPPPAWALWERYLLDHLHLAALEFVQRYTRPDGSLIWRQVWPGMDGSDDGYESFFNFPLYYALGGPPVIHELSRKLWDAVTRQFTAYGQIYRDFDGYYDWMHHGESYVYHYFFGLADPARPKDQERALRFAALYTGDDPEARNWDPELKLIRSPLNGSRGPRFVTTAEDWSTHRSVLAGYPLPFDDIPGVTSSHAWIDDAQFPALLEAMNRRMMRGDVPLNLTATSLVTNAYMYTGDARYRTWVLDYVRAWEDRTRRNGGVVPDNVGPGGKIGECMDGKWWGGYYGWRWPHGLFNLLESTLIGAANALLLTGDRTFLELPRSLLDLVARERKAEGGKVLVPHKRGDAGWYAWRELNPQYPISLWYLSGDPADWACLEKVCNPQAWGAASYAKQKGDSGNEAGWVHFLRGGNPDYPAEILAATWAESQRRLDLIRSDTTAVEEQDVHHWQQRNPVVLEGLVQLMLGGPNHIYHGGLLHSRLRYFDPEGRRPGVPPQVAALVEAIRPGGLTLHLVNLHPAEPRDVILQAGAFAEHRFTRARAGGREQALEGPHLLVRLGPGAAGKLELDMERFARPPTYAFPWHGGTVPVR